jgi:diacylglycerol kinase
MTFRVVRPDVPPEPVPTPPRSPSRRTWGAKFREAFRGVKLGVRGQSSFFVHFFVATLVIVTAAMLQCDLAEWCLLLGCIGAVVTAELFNSAIEQMFRGLDVAARDRHHGALDIAAGAVLVASIAAAVIGVIIFGRRIVPMIWANG